MTEAVDLEKAEQLALKLPSPGFVIDLIKEIRSLRAELAASQLDARRWRHCIEHGWPRLCISPQLPNPYWRLPSQNLVGQEYDTPADAVDASLQSQQ
jgi:hypothetical protein